MDTKSEVKTMRIIRAIEGEGESQKTEDFEACIVSTVLTSLGPWSTAQVFRSVGANERGGQDSCL